jgi:hypothetical protein
MTRIQEVGPVEMMAQHSGMKRVFVFEDLFNGDGVDEAIGPGFELGWLRFEHSLPVV